MPQWDPRLGMRAHGGEGPACVAACGGSPSDEPQAFPCAFSSYISSPIDGNYGL